MTRPCLSPSPTLGDYISSLGLKQFRVAETEKYAHVTFFFNGGVEKETEGEVRCLVPSPKEFPTYDLIPEMSAFKVCDKVVEAIASDEYGLIVCNFANCDMVGHTGIMPAAIKAVETVDACMGRIMDEVKKHPDTVLLVTADHGNADCMFDEATGKVNTAHTTNPVPFAVCEKGIGHRAASRQTRRHCADDPACHGAGSAQGNDGRVPGALRKKANLRWRPGRAATLL